MIDLLLYTAAKTRNLNFLKRDLSLIKFLKEIGEDTRSILSEEFLEKYGGSNNSFPY